MQVLRDAWRSADLPYGAVATIGNYDGIHRGQRVVLERVVERAREAGAPSVVISFDPHPLSVLRPESAPQRLTTDEQREGLLRDLEIDALLVLRFTPELARVEARAFVETFLHQRLAVREIHVGSGFAFGRDRLGNLELLRELGLRFGFEAHGVEEVVSQGRVISSTRIRRALLEGRVEEALDLLGRPFALRGRIVRGDRMGARLGWPTINLQTENELIPAPGVYSGRAFFPSFPATFDCVTNIGTRPTVYENFQQVVESHILGFHSDVYGETVEVSFYKRLREEQMFPTVMDLSAQIGRDVEATREYFAARRRLEECAESG